MAIFALGDPHFSFSTSGQEYKPMGIFGDNWLITARRSKLIGRVWLALKM